LKKNFAGNFEKKMANLNKNLSFYDKKIDRNIGFHGKRPFVCRKSPKIGIITLAPGSDAEISCQFKAAALGRGRRGWRWG
jgi:hypothetical protein